MRSVKDSGGYLLPYAMIAIVEQSTDGMGEKQCGI
jgi:hypothetical protein